VFDYSNWKGVVDAVDEALKDLEANIVFKRLILNDEESATQWWNGLYIIVLNSGE
jgi:hypothetical protein